MKLLRYNYHPLFTHRVNIWFGEPFCAPGFRTSAGLLEFNCLPITRRLFAAPVLVFYGCVTSAAQVISLIYSFFLPSHMNPVSVTTKLHQVFSHTFGRIRSGPSLFMSGLFSNQRAPVMHAVLYFVREQRLCSWNVLPHKHHKHMTMQVKFVTSCDAFELFSLFHIDISHLFFPTLSNADQDNPNPDVHSPRLVRTNLAKQCRVFPHNFVLSGTCCSCIFSNCCENIDFCFFCFSPAAKAQPF